jgi:uncharacterized membrane protein YidH (DUF202 family)
MVVLSAILVAVFALVRWATHRDYHSGSVDLLLFGLLFFLVLAVVSGSAGSGIVDWSRRQGRFRIIAREDDPGWFYLSYVLNVLVAVVFVFVLYLLPSLK